MGFNKEGFNKDTHRRIVRDLSQQLQPFRNHWIVSDANK
jgi:hypothetical protein